MSPREPPFCRPTSTKYRYVDADDRATWEMGFGTSVGASHMQGDADGDFDADGADYDKSRAGDFQQLINA